MITSRTALAALVIAVFSSAALPSAAHSTKELPAKFRKSPYSLMSLTIGHPNDGWQIRAKRLKKNRYLRIKSGSEKRSYGHPALVLMLRRSAREVARAVHGSVMLVGDLSTKYGGPLSGHHSHQSGRDADVSFYMRDADDKSVIPDHFVVFGSDGKAVDGSGRTFDDRRNWLLVQSWVRDKRAGLSHIFVERHLRHRLLAYGQSRPAFKKYVPEVAALLEQPENAEPHNDHFHVRVSCPKRQKEICREESR